MDKSIQNIFIFGIGHLGQFLLDELKDYQVTGTKTKSQSSIIAYKLGEEISSLPPTDLVIWAIPPRDAYKKSLALANEYFSKRIPWIFVSSTSVYQSEGIKTEESKRDGKGHIIELEDILYEMDRKISIIRPSGLVDLKRNPKNFFKGRSNLSGGDSPVNLVHTQDVAHFIRFIIDKNLCGEDFNLASETHLSKSQFYNLVQDQKLSFSSEGSLNRIISSEKAKSFGYQFLYPDVLDYFLKSKSL